MEESESQDKVFNANIVTEFFKNFVYYIGLLQEEVVMYDANDLSKIFNVNVNTSTNFLKKFGVYIGHWQIAKIKLLLILIQNEGVIN